MSAAEFESSPLLRRRRILGEGTPAVAVQRYTEG